MSALNVKLSQLGVLTLLAGLTALTDRPHLHLIVPWETMTAWLVGGNKSSKITLNIVKNPSSTYHNKQHFDVDVCVYDNSS